MIQLLPYSKVNGVWSLTDEALADAFHKTLEQGSIQEIFWDGKIQSPQDFINFF